jgi:5,10-methylenetetrahydrofolate reductase
MMSRRSPSTSVPLEIDGFCAFSGPVLSLHDASMPFEVVWEVDPPAQSDRARLHRQIAAVHGLATAALVPDNPTGRASVSSLAIADTLQSHGLPAIACLNARDRNLLGFRRDLLTARYLGIDDLLLVRGDRPTAGERTEDLSVHAMLAECRSELGDGVRVAVTTKLRPLPAWKESADRLFVQVTWSLDDLLRWRDATSFAGPVLPAVLVVPSSAMARRLAVRVPELAVPRSWLAAIDTDPTAGFRLAADLVERIRASGAFDGVHIVGGQRFRTAADAIRTRLAASMAVAAP